MPHDTTKQDPESLDAVTSGWRFRLGLSFFVLAILSPLGVPLVALTDLSTVQKATLSGLFLAGLPEVYTVTAVALLGKSGFNYLKGKLFAYLKRYAPAQKVSRTRYKIGLGMLIIPIIFGFLTAYIPHYIPGYAHYHLLINLALDFIFIASLFVLGGEFWDKLYALFVYEAKVQYPDREPRC